MAFFIFVAKAESLELELGSCYSLTKILMRHSGISLSSSFRNSPTFPTPPLSASYLRNLQRLQLSSKSLGLEAALKNAMMLAS